MERKMTFFALRIIGTIILVTLLMSLVKFGIPFLFTPEKVIVSTEQIDGYVTI